MEITNASTWFLLLIFTVTIHQSFAARTLQGSLPPPAHLEITFSMLDVLGGKDHRAAAQKPVNSHFNNRLPFSKPRGYYNPPTTAVDPGPMSAVLPSQMTLDLDGISMSFPAVASLQEMELGAVTPIDEDIYGGGATAASFVGKAQGVYVASSDGGNGTHDHMLAMTASFFSSGYRDRLKFFGVHRDDAGESHVAVIGGSGRYRNANGFATVRTVNVSASSEEVYKLLVFSVNLG